MTGHNVRRIVLLVLLIVGAAAALAVGVPHARGVVVGVAPTTPISSTTPGPPPITVLPAAGDATPPADAIADPVTAGASCGGWYRQSNYGNRWAAASTWWEYRCSYDTTFYSNPCTVGACDAFCWYCYWETQDWTDYFYWDGSAAVFYGEAYSDSVVWEGGIAPDSSSAAWWDAPTAQWYGLGPYTLTISKQGAGSGDVNSTPAGISCGYSCEASFDAGTVVTLTATAGASSIFTGWSGDCSGTGSCTLTIAKASSVTATFAPTTANLTVVKAGTGSGTVMSAPAGISCGEACGASFAAGTVVELTPTAGPGSIFAGWSGDCSGAGSCAVTMDQARSVTATFNVNVPPHGSFTVSCISLSCTFDGGVSTDPDDEIATWTWNFGDGVSVVASSSSYQHVYGRAGTYTVTLTVTDRGGATGSATATLNPMSLSARGYKRNGLKVDLSWNGATGGSFDVYRNAVRLTTAQTTSYTDSVGGVGTYTYTVCAVATAICSNTATVSF